MAAERYRVWVKPGSRAGRTVTVDGDGTLVVCVPERAVDGAANGGVLAALAAHWGVRARDVRIVSGATSRIKTVMVDRA